MAGNYVKQVYVHYFGDRLLNAYPAELQPSPFLVQIPGEFEYNSGWKLIHSCPRCSNEVTIFEDFNKQERNFRWISRLNSNKHSKTLLLEVCKMLSKLVLVEISGVLYINRVGFNYQFDFQRKASVNLLLYKCLNCNSVFLGNFKIGYPLFPEFDKPKGKIGKIILEELVCLNEEWVAYPEIISFLKN